ncbi:ATP-grasp domain-containing protein [Patescibacteria group bacterium]|nr:ATP-grasp domain-containing protein [Patescibacteria group bacterium]
MENKTLLVVGTGYPQKRFVLQRIKKLGVTAIILNQEKNWALPYADYWIVADNNHHAEAIQAVENFLNDHPQVKIDGVITYWEDDVLLTAKLAEKLKLIGIPYAIAKKTRNKALFRKFCSENHIPAPQFKIIRNSDDLISVKKKFGFPLVIKPVFGSSSAYVVKIEDKEELEETYQYVRNNLSSQVESALNDGSEIMVEEYIDGDEVDIDILIQNGKIKFYTISDNDQTDEPFFVETGRQTPSSLPEKNQAELMEMAEETLEKLGIQNGCIHFEAKSTKKGAFPLEVNLRLGGDEIYSSVKQAWSVDLIENAVKIAFGEYIKIKKPDIPLRYVVSRDFLSVHSGLLAEFEVDPGIKKLRQVDQVHFHKKIGEAVLVPPEGYEYLGWISVTGENAIDAGDNLQEAMKKISYRVAKFDPASSIGKTTRLNSFSSAALRKDLLRGAAKIETIRRISRKNQRKLHIGIACNIYEKETNSVEQDLMSVGKNIQKTLEKRGYRISFFDFNNLPQVFNELRRSNVDIVFNVCERINDSSLLEPHAASILDTLQIPYTGSNPFTLALCIDKIRVKKLLAFHDIPTPRWDYAYTIDDELDDSLKFPLIVKPGNTDNSIGITNDSVVTNSQELEKQLKKIIVDVGRPALIEEYIEGDEYDVSIIGSDETDLRVLPLSRSIFKNLPQGYWHIYPFAAKWDEDEIYDRCIVVQRPPKIDKKLESLISEIALDTYNILDCHDYGRVEIRVDKNDNPYVLELNPNPSINIGDCVPNCAKMVGMDYGDFIEEIVSMAVRRYKNRPPYYHLQTNLL